jgi:hypothetical protein
MKRLSLVFFSLFILCLLFFTIFGNVIYDRITPEVSSYTVGGVYWADDISYYQIPREALLEYGFVYEIVSEQVFSREIYTLQMVEIIFQDSLFEWDDGNSIYVSQGLRSGMRVLRAIDDSLGDGDRVRLSRRR